METSTCAATSSSEPAFPTTSFPTRADSANAYWYWGRPSNEDLRRDLRDITRTIRTDWDLGARGLRERWGAGAREDFWPYGRSMREVLAGRDAVGGA